MRKLFFPVTLFFFPVAMYSQNPGEWTWMHGNLQSNQTGSFGTQGVTAPANLPPTVSGTACWKDLQGNFWMFGGYDVFLNVNSSDLWKYDPAINQWTWMKGPGTNHQYGTYGTQGVPAPGNNPGYHIGASCTWVDKNGDLWLFGGDGAAANTFGSLLNDLWRYNIASNMWTWMGGANYNGAPAVYGTMGVPSVNNIPSARTGSAYWTDSQGNFWLYGGYTVNTGYAQYNGQLSDLWKFNPVTLEWTWVNGSSTQLSVLPSWGTKNIASPSNTPGGRSNYGFWKDKSDNLWLFGGLYDANSIAGTFNDLWKFDMGLGQWIWIRGSNIPYWYPSTAPPPTPYPQMCVPDSLNDPSPRSLGMGGNANCWTDTCGNFWMWGGTDLSLGAGSRADLWYYNVKRNEWTWMNGVSAFMYAGNYGTQLVSSPTNLPRGTEDCAGWVDNNNDLWMWGCWGAPGGHWADMVRFVPDPNCPSYKPDASFYADSLAGCAPFTVHFNSDSSRFSENYSWNFGDGGNSILQDPVHTYSLPGVYTVTLITWNNYKCIPEYDTLVLTNYITANDVPPMSALVPDTTICEGAVVNFDAGNVPSCTYSWSTGATTHDIVVSSEGYYSVIVSNNYCTNRDTVHLHVTRNIDLPASVSLCDQNSSVMLGGTYSSGTYSWSTGETTQQIEVSGEGVYWVNYNSGNCFSSDTIVVKGVLGGYALFVPNSFTPNADGKNEIFLPVGDNVSSIHMVIYDRWGNRIYETHSMSDGWNGFYKGELVQEDVYVYIVDFTTNCSGEDQLRRIGHVSVIR